MRVAVYWPLRIFGYVSLSSGQLMLRQFSRFTKRSDEGSSPQQDCFFCRSTVDMEAIVQRPTASVLYGYGSSEDGGIGYGLESHEGIDPVMEALQAESVAAAAAERESELIVRSTPEIILQAFSVTPRQLTIALTSQAKRIRLLTTRLNEEQARAAVIAASKCGVGYAAAAGRQHQQPADKTVGNSAPASPEAPPATAENHLVETLAAENNAIDTGRKSDSSYGSSVGSLEHIRRMNSSGSSSDDAKDDEDDEAREVSPPAVAVAAPGPLPTVTASAAAAPSIPKLAGISGASSNSSNSGSPSKHSGFTPRLSFGGPGSSTPGGGGGGVITRSSSRASVTPPTNRATPAANAVMADASPVAIAQLPQYSLGDDELANELAKCEDAMRIGKKLKYSDEAFRKLVREEAKFPAFLGLVLLQRMVEGGVNAEADMALLEHAIKSVKHHPDSTKTSPAGSGSAAHHHGPAPSAFSASASAGLSSPVLGRVNGTSNSGTAKPTLAFGSRTASVEGGAGGGGEAADPALRSPFQPAGRLNALSVSGGAAATSSMLRASVSPLSPSNASACKTQSFVAAPAALRNGPTSVMSTTTHGSRGGGRGSAKGVLGFGSPSASHAARSGVRLPSNPESAAQRRLVERQRQAARMRIMEQQSISILDWCRLWLPIEMGAADRSHRFAVLLTPSPAPTVVKAVLDSRAAAVTSASGAPAAPAVQAPLALKDRTMESKSASAQSMCDVSTAEISAIRERTAALGSRLESLGHAFPYVSCPPLVPGHLPPLHRVEPGDIAPVIEALVERHPDLAYLRPSPVFRQRYTAYVVANLFASVHGQCSGDVSLTELLKCGVVDTVYLTATSSIASVHAFSQEAFSSINEEFTVAAAATSAESKRGKGELGQKSLMRALSRHASLAELRALPDSPREPDGKFASGAGRPSMPATLSRIGSAMMGNKALSPPQPVSTPGAAGGGSGGRTKREEKKVRRLSLKKLFAAVDADAGEDHVFDGRDGRMPSPNPAAALAHKREKERLMEEAMAKSTLSPANGEEKDGGADDDGDRSPVVTEATGDASAAGAPDQAKGGRKRIASWFGTDLRASLGIAVGQPSPTRAGTGLKTSPATSPTSGGGDAAMFKPGAGAAGAAVSVSSVTLGIRPRAASIISPPPMPAHLLSLLAMQDPNPATDDAAVVSLPCLLQHMRVPISTIVLERIFDGRARPLASGSKGRLSFEDVAWMMAATADRMTDASVEYWMRCLDIDDDGALGLGDVESAYEGKAWQLREAGAKNVMSAVEVMDQVSWLWCCN